MFDPARSESCVPLLTECNQQGKHALELENLYIYRHTYYTCFLANIASICPAPSHTGGIGTASDTELAGCEPLGRWSWHELGDVGAHGGPKFNMFLLV